MDKNVLRLQEESSRKHKEKLRIKDAEKVAKESVAHLDHQNVEEIIKNCQESLAEIRLLSVQFSSDRALVESLRRERVRQTISVRDLDSSLKKTTKGISSLIDREKDFSELIMSDSVSDSLLKKKNAEFDKQLSTWQRNLIGCAEKSIDILNKAIKELQDDDGKEDVIRRAQNLIEKSNTLISKIRGTP